MFLLSLVVVNEMMWAKTEYIELYNTESEEVSLEGWKITRQKPPVGDVDQPEETIVSFGSSDTVSANGYFLIEANEDATSVQSNKVKSSLGLVDGGVLLRIRSQDDTVVDAANQLGAWFAGKNTDVGESMERKSPDAAGDEADSWYTSVGDIGGRIGTPGATNSEIASSGESPSPEPSPSPSPTVYSTNIVINEFLPNPEGDDALGEFIELFNSGSVDVDLSEWILDDAVDSGSAPFSIPDETIIPAKGFAVFYRPQTKISLNNDTDHVRLIRPDGVIQGDVGYITSKEKHSYNRTDAEKYEQSSNITPRATNSITTVSTPTSKPKADDSDDDEDSKKSSVSYNFSLKIFINEILPNPDGDDAEHEFIELKSNDTKTINLLGWSLDDGNKGSAPYRFTEKDILAPGKILVFFRNKTKLALNNDEDVARLLDPNGKIISSIQYTPKVEEGHSYNRTQDGGYLWSETTTPGKENTIFIQEKASPTPKKKTAKKPAAPKKVATPRVLAAIASSIPSPLPWPDDGAVSRVVVGKTSTGNSQAKKSIFVLFGVSMASMQLVSGISSKERIWQK